MRGRQNPAQNQTKQQAKIGKYSGIQGMKIREKTTNNSITIQANNPLKPGSTKVQCLPSQPARESYMGQNKVQVALYKKRESVTFTYGPR